MKLHMNSPRHCIREVSDRFFLLVFHLPFSTSMQKGKKKKSHLRSKPKNSPPLNHIRTNSSEAQTTDSYLMSAENKEKQFLGQQSCFPSIQSSSIGKLSDSQQRAIERLFSSALKRNPKMHLQKS